MGMHRPFKFDIKNKNPLNQHLKSGYTAKARDNMSYQGYSDDSYRSVAAGRMYQPEIFEALSWVALENLMEKMFKL